MNRNKATSIARSRKPQRAYRAEAFAAGQVARREFHFEIKLPFVGISISAGRAGQNPAPHLKNNLVGQNSSGAKFEGAKMNWARRSKPIFRAVTCPQPTWPGPTWSLAGYLFDSPLDK